MAHMPRLPRHALPGLGSSGAQCPLGLVLGELGRAGAWPMRTSWANLLEGCGMGSPSSPLLKTATRQKRKKKDDRWNRDVIDTYKAARERSILDRES